MVVANSGWAQNVNYIPTKNDNNLNLPVDSNKMSAKGILIRRDNSHVFQDRTLNLDQAVKIGRSVARIKAATDNAIFDCKVLSRNHALLWYNGGKFYLRDTGSSNGTFVNNQRLSATGLQSANKEVWSGDIVQFGVDVVESTKKVTHGCIIATLKLYHPDGKEAVCSRSKFITSPAGDVTLQDLYKLNQYVQEANRREKVLHSKLVYLQKLVENTKKAACQSWKALIDEDRLMLRVKTVESELIFYSKNCTEDRIRNELIKLEEEKSHYQIAAKEALQRVHQEKLEITQKLVQLESRLNETEEECQCLYEISKNSQIELQQLAAKHTTAQKTLAQFEEKLAEQEQNSTDFIIRAVRERHDLIKKVKHQSKIGRELQCKLNENRLDSAKIHKKLIGIKNYMQTLEHMNAKLLTDDSKDSLNPVEPINAILDTLNEMIADTDNVNHPEKFENPDNAENIFDIEEDEIELRDFDSVKKHLFDYVGLSFLTKDDIEDSNNDSDNFAKYILPPSNSRRTLINGKADIDEHNEEHDLNSDSNDDTSSVISSVDRPTTLTSEDFDEKSTMENKLVADSDTNSLLQADVSNKYQINFSHNINDQQSQSHYYNKLQINNRIEDDDSSNSSDFLNESGLLRVSTMRNNNEGTDNQSKDDNIDELSLDDDSMKLKMEEKKKEKNLEKEFEVREDNDEKNIDNKIDENNIDSHYGEESRQKEDEIDNGKSNDYENVKTKDGGYIKTLKPLVKNSEHSVTHSNTSDYILHLFMSSLESIKSDDKIEVQQFVKKELDELRNWFIHESYDVVIEKFKTLYYRTKNNETRMQEMAEELVILKEKYSICHDEKTEICKKYTMLKSQCGDILNTNYSVPIQYFVPVAIAFLWMLFEEIF